MWHIDPVLFGVLAAAAEEEACADLPGCPDCGEDLAWDCDDEESDDEWRCLPRRPDGRTRPSVEAHQL